MEAFLIAEDLLCRRYSDQETVKTVKKQFSLTWSRARKVIDDVKRTWRKEALSKREDNKKEALKVLARLTRMAMEKKDVRAAERVERLRAEINGLLGGDPDDVVIPEQRDEDFEDRTDEDLDYYINNGFFPEEAPKTMQ